MSRLNDNQLLGCQQTTTMNQDAFQKLGLMDQPSIFDQKFQQRFNMERREESDPMSQEGLSIKAKTQQSGKSLLPTNRQDDSAASEHADQLIDNHTNRESSLKPQMQHIEPAAFYKFEGKGLLKQVKPNRYKKDQRLKWSLKDPLNEPLGLKSIQTKGLDSLLGSTLRDQQSSHYTQSPRGKTQNIRTACESSHQNKRYNELRDSCSLRASLNLFNSKFSNVWSSQDQKRGVPPPTKANKRLVQVVLDSSIGEQQKVYVSIPESTAKQLTQQPKSCIQPFLEECQQKLGLSSRLRQVHLPDGTLIEGLDQIPPHSRKLIVSSCQSSSSPDTNMKSDQIVTFEQRKPLQSHQQHPSQSLRIKSPNQVDKNLVHKELEKHGIDILKNQEFLEDLTMAEKSKDSLTSNLPSTSKSLMNYKRVMKDMLSVQQTPLQCLRAEKNFNFVGGNQQQLSSFKPLVSFRHSKYPHYTRNRYQQKRHPQQADSKEKAQRYNNLNKDSLLLESSQASKLDGDKVNITVIESNTLEGSYQDSVLNSSANGFFQNFRKHQTGVESRQKKRTLDINRSQCKRQNYTSLMSARDRQQVNQCKNQATKPDLQSLSQPIEQPIRQQKSKAKESYLKAGKALGINNYNNKYKLLKVFQEKQQKKLHSRNCSQHSQSSQREASLNLSEKQEFADQIGSILEQESQLDKTNKKSLASRHKNLESQGSQRSEGLRLRTSATEGTRRTLLDRARINTAQTDNNPKKVSFILNTPRYKLNSQSLNNRQISCTLDSRQDRSFNAPLKAGTYQQSPAQTSSSIKAKVSKKEVQRYMKELPPFHRHRIFTSSRGSRNNERANFIMKNIKECSNNSVHQTVDKELNHLMQLNIPKMQLECAFSRKELYNIYSKFKTLAKVTQLRHPQRQAVGVDKDIFISGLKDQGSASDDFLEKVFQSIDIGKRGFIGWEDFFGASKLINSTVLKDKIDLFFNLIDADGNGRFSYEEIKDVCQLSLMRFKERESDSMRFELDEEISDFYVRYIFKQLGYSTDQEIPEKDFKKGIFEGDQETRELLAMFCCADTKLLDSATEEK